MSVTTRTEPAVQTRTPGLDEASLGQLTARMSEQVSRLVRDELALAQAEAKQKAKRLGVGVGLFGAGGAVAFFGLGVAVAAGVLGLATVLAAWLAAVIVAGALFVVAGVAALAGRFAVARGTPPLPEGAIDSTKTDVATVREAMKR